MIKLYFREIEEAKSNSNTLTNHFIGDYLKTGIKCFQIGKSEHGKPYLIDHPNIHFNISHTGNAFVCALADEPVGVDIETEKRFHKGIARKFFTVDEQKYVFDKPNRQHERFTEIWVKKEAYVKWLGLGLSMPFYSFDVLEDRRIKVYRIGKYIIGICSDAICRLNKEFAIEICSG